MRTLIFFGLSIIVCACGASESTENTNLEIDSSTVQIDSLTNTETKGETLDHDFISTILGAYVEVSYEVKGSDTSFHICSDANNSFTLTKDLNKEGSYSYEWQGLNDAFNGILVSANETAGGFEFATACPDYPDCDSNTEVYKYYRNGIMSQNGSLFVLESNAKNYKRKDCGIFEMEEI